MPPLRILVVDDEPLARERVRQLVAGNATVEIIGEAGDGREAIAAVAALRPDILILDVQMPGRDGLQVLADLPDDLRPAVVFATGHEHFAVEAFRLKAVDYLLKPFDRERLLAAIMRAGDWLRQRRAIDVEERIRALVAPLSAPTRERFVIRTRGRVVMVRRDELVWIEAANNYSIVHLKDRRRIMIREPIGELAERLSAPDFVRINRSAIVRVDQVRELRTNDHGDYTVVLCDGEQLTLSRALRGRLDVFFPS